MSAKEVMPDGFRELTVSPGETRTFMLVPYSDAVAGLCHVEKDVSIRHLVVKKSTSITQGNITLTLSYPAISTPPQLVLDSSSSDVVIWDVPLGDVKTVGSSGEASSAIRVKMEASSDLSPSVSNLTLQVMLDNDLSEDWCDLVAVYSKANLTKNSTVDMSVYRWGNYVSPGSGKLSRVLFRMFDGPISRGTVDILVHVNSVLKKTITLDSSTSNISHVDLLNDNISLSINDEVSLVAKPDRKLSPSGHIDLEVGLEVQHL